MFENEMWLEDPFTRAQAWVDLFANANHKDGAFRVRGNRVEVKRGQIGWSELTMAKRWQWSRQRVRRFLEYLTQQGQIRQQKLHKITSITTIINYDTYQSDTTDDTTERQQKDNRRYTNKNDKNVKNDKKLASQSDAGLISKSISLFEGVNPSFGRWYANTTQRGATDRLLVAHGYERLEKVIALLPKTNGMQFFPTITTPTQLEDKWASLESALIRKKGETKRTVLI